MKRGWSNVIIEGSNLIHFIELNCKPPEELSFPGFFPYAPWGCTLELPGGVLKI